MRRHLVVVRPEPGNGRTVAAARAAGWIVDAMPLFAVVPIAWTPPDAAAFDALLLTSANAARYAGDALTSLATLPAFVVGDATAAVARDAGLTIALTGSSDAAALVDVARAHGFSRLIHLAGRDRVDQPGVIAVTVYASNALPALPDAAARFDDAVVLLHSARAARRVAALVGSRARVAVAALSPAVLSAAEGGWRAAAVATQPTDAALLLAAATLAD